MTSHSDVTASGLLKATRIKQMENTKYIAYLENEIDSLESELEKLQEEINKKKEKLEELKV